MLRRLRKEKGHCLLTLASDFFVCLCAPHCCNWLCFTHIYYICALREEGCAAKSGLYLDSDAMNERTNEQKLKEQNVRIDCEDL